MSAILSKTFTAVRVHHAARLIVRFVETGRMDFYVKPLGSVEKLEKDSYFWWASIFHKEKLSQEAQCRYTTYLLQLWPKHQMHLFSTYSAFVALQRHPLEEQRAILEIIGAYCGDGQQNSRGHKDDNMQERTTL